MKTWSIYTRDIYSALTKKKKMEVADKQKEMETILLSEGTETQKDKRCIFFFIWMLALNL